jgi:N-dimethylarginine dimethylaminohydrolase
MVGRLRRVLVCAPTPGFASADPHRWHYGGRPDGARAACEHSAYVDVLSAAGVAVETLCRPPAEAADAMFTCDTSLMTDRGAVLLRMGKALRRPEVQAAASTYDRLGVPVLGELCPPATAEGGDLFWLDSATLLAGRSARTNDAGIATLADLLADDGVEVLSVDVPPPESPSACMHLGSLVSLLDIDLALVHRPLLPAGLRRLLDDRGFRLVDSAVEEYATLATNVLALAPRECLALDGNPQTRRRLEAAGCRVRTYPGTEISLNAEGGPTCLARPLFRDDAGDLRRDRRDAPRAG